MATLHIARRTTPHPLAALTGWLTAHLRRRPAPVPDVQALDIEALRLALPLDDPDRHLLENPAVEDAFAHLAIDHPEAVTPADGGAPARDADREQRLLALCDAWFRDLHGPEHRWSPRTIAVYTRLMANVRACFHPGGEA